MKKQIITLALTTTLLMSSVTANAASIEMCFDPQSPLNGKLKETLFNMIKGSDSE